MRQMKQPTVTQAYAMIRALKKRAAKGDAEKIKALQDIIDEQRNREALLDLERFFPSAK